MSRDDHVRRLAASKGFDRTIPNSGVLPGDVVDLFQRDLVPAEDLLMRLRQMPEFPEPVLDAGAFESPLDMIERCDKLKNRVALFWVIDEDAGQVKRCETVGGAFVTSHVRLGPSRDYRIVERWLAGETTWEEAVALLGIVDEEAIRRDLAAPRPWEPIMKEHGVSVEALEVVCRRMERRPGHHLDDMRPFDLDDRWVLVSELLDRHEVLAILDKVPDVDSDPGDELPKKWSKPCK